MRDYQLTQLISTANIFGTVSGGLRLVISLAPRNGVVFFERYTIRNESLYVLC